jgi:hypothetical protein
MANKDRPRYGNKRPQKERDKPQVGRPPILTEVLIAKVCKMLSHGCFLETACLAHNIKKSLLYDWFEKGNNILSLVEQGETKFTRRELLYADFVERLPQAIAKGETLCVEKIHLAYMQGDWQAGKFLLTHGPSKDRWAVLKQHDHTHEGEIQHKHSFTPVDSLGLTLEEKKLLLQKVQQARLQQTRPSEQIKTLEGNTSGSCKTTVTALLAAKATLESSDEEE